jgi:hypothetical protein
MVGNRELRRLERLGISNLNNPNLQHLLHDKLIPKHFLTKLSKLRITKEQGLKKKKKTTR